MKGVLPWLVSWALQAGTINFCPALAVLVGTVQNMFFLTKKHYPNSFVPIAKQAWQAVVPGRLSLSMCFVPGRLSLYMRLWRRQQKLRIPTYIIPLRI
jgi:hypothetical protein